ncbi:MAG: hypothetical protein K2Y22_16010 [Candidatus Obscuribacterales bacterium]|nr:hypothetical protein [Candidatus Obscuribacterales bacterium]
MASFPRRILSLFLTLIMLGGLAVDVSAQKTFALPPLSKVADEKLNDYDKQVKEIKDKTADTEAQDKQLQRVADDATGQGVKFIEDAGGKMFAVKEQIDSAVGEYVTDLVTLLGAKRLCPLLKKLVGPGGKYHDVQSKLWADLRRIFHDHCVVKPIEEPGGGIKLGDDPGPSGGQGPSEISDGPCPEGYPLLEDCVKEHNLTVSLYGDGQTTSTCTLSISDNMGHTATAPIKTVCASRKSLLPPVGQDKAAKQNLTYTVVTGGNPKAMSLVITAKDLDKQGKFNDVHLKPEKRCSTISQLAIWKDIGGSTPGNKDSITSDSIKTDMLHKSGINPKTLTKEENQQLTNRVDAICASVDLTLKECPKTQEKTKDKSSSNHILISYHYPSENMQLAQIKIAQGKCCIPAGTVFVPSKKEKYQDMMCVEDQVFDCPPTDGLITDNCNWVFAKQILLPKNPHNELTEGRQHDDFEKERATRITEELERIAEVEGELIDEDEAAQPNEKYKDFDIILLYVCVDKTGHPRSAKHAIVSAEEKKYWNPEGDLDVRKVNKEGRKAAVKNHRPK